MLFKTLATTTLPSNVPWAYIGAFYGASFATFALGIAFARYGLGWSRRDQGIAGIAAGYSNMVMLGFPLVITAFGDAAALPLFILLALQSMLMFPLTTWVIEVYGRREGAQAHSLLKMLGAAFARDTEIVPDGALRIDRSLRAERLATRYGYSAPPWPQMVDELAAEWRSRKDAAAPALA